MTTDRASPDAPHVLGLGLLGAAACGGVALAGPGSVEAFRDHPYLVVWLFLVVAQGALYGILPPVLFQRLRALWPDLRAQPGATLVFAICVVAFAAAVPLATATLIELDHVLPYQEVKWRVLSAAGVVLVALPAALGILGVECAARRIGGSAGAGSDMARFLELREGLSFFLAVLGAIVAVATLIAGASRRAIAPGLPPEIIAAYGGHFTLLVAMVYAPAHLTMAQLGRRLIEGKAASDEARSEVERGLKTGVRNSLETSVPVLAPLLSGLLALAFK